MSNRKTSPMYTVISKTRSRPWWEGLLHVSFQEFTNKFACFVGDGTVEDMIGWGETMEAAAANLYQRKVLGWEDGFANITLLEGKRKRGDKSMIPYNPQ